MLISEAVKPYKAYSFERLFRELNPEGLPLEFGVGKGDTMRIFQEQTSRPIYGFDWFKGLPETWGTDFPKGFFNCDDIPDFKASVQLVVGLFRDTLPGFLAEHEDPVAFAHMDADLYSSTKFVLDRLKDRFVPGTILAFDEIKGMKCAIEHEQKAFQEFLDETGQQWEYLGERHSDSGFFKRVA